MTQRGNLRLAAGMVGGGYGADIGKTHRQAMRIDDQYRLVARVLDVDPQDSARMAAELSTLVPGRRVFDNATVRLRLSNGAPATLWASMAATGNEHGLRLRVFGDRAALEWRHEDPHHLIIRDLDGGSRILAQGMASLSDDATRLTRPGLGHPEGFLEAFANFYRDLADLLRARRDETATPTRDLTIPTGPDGLVGVQFVEAVTQSHDHDGDWVTPTFALAGV